MEGSVVRPAIILSLLLLLLLPEIIAASRQHLHHGHHHPTTRSKITDMRMVKPTNGVLNRPERRPLLMKHKKPDTLQVAGSRLPDCSHACGSCTPCRLVMVSFVCATIEEAESCPMAYRCMCNNKSYPVP